MTVSFERRQLFTKISNWDKIVQRIGGGMNPFDIPKKMTRIQQELILIMIREEDIYFRSKQKGGN